MAQRPAPPDRRTPAPPGGVLYAAQRGGYRVGMLRLTQAPNIAIATLWTDLLCEAGWPASVQRQYLGAAAGTLPPDECLPEIWLEYEEHAPQARLLLAQLQQLPQRRWHCCCGELVEGGFEQCWACGALMPLAP